MEIDLVKSVQGQRHGAGQQLSLSLLPPELLSDILRFLDVRSFVCCSRVCKFCYGLSGVKSSRRWGLQQELRVLQSSRLGSLFTDEMESLFVNNYAEIAAIHCVHCMEDVVVVGGDSTDIGGTVVHVFSATSGELLEQLYDGELLDGGGVRSVESVGRTLFCGLTTGDGAAIHAWNIGLDISASKEHGVPVVRYRITPDAELRGHRRTVYALAVTECRDSSPHLVSASSDRTVRLWDITSVLLGAPDADEGTRHLTCVRVLHRHPADIDRLVVLSAWGAIAAYGFDQLRFAQLPVAPNTFGVDAIQKSVLDGLDCGVENILAMKWCNRRRVLYIASTTAKLYCFCEAEDGTKSLVCTAVSISRSPCRDFSCNLHLSGDMVFIRKYGELAGIDVFKHIRNKFTNAVKIERVCTIYERLATSEKISGIWRDMALGGKKRNGCCYADSLFLIRFRGWFVERLLRAKLLD